MTRTSSAGEPSTLVASNPQISAFPTSIFNPTQFSQSRDEFAVISISHRVGGRKARIKNRLRQCHAVRLFGKFLSFVASSESRSLWEGEKLEIFVHSSAN
jgi:hypothetical protein